MGRVRPVGIEPTNPCWEHGKLPLHHGRDQSRRWESNPHPSPYESAAQPVELRRPPSTSDQGGSRTLSDEFLRLACLPIAPPGRMIQYRWLGSNQRPIPYERSALPTELHRYPSLRDRTRTCTLRLPKPARYQVAPLVAIAGHTLSTGESARCDGRSRGIVVCVAYKEIEARAGERFTGRGDSH